MSTKRDSDIQQPLLEGLRDSAPSANQQKLINSKEEETKKESFSEELMEA
ncbi:UNKNOWN [Stylonychia lemnae]|uniref:Uncharacterized protein n=1 Tax=Stylonychia lemnae TaxID=5949 RepID=A0A078ACI1_STYLE|nr:UNKNOWN [Stylonychia lemnae]|eukprot:CDW79571.1 UNKNOWN [Stylonychia lemnae]